MRLLKAESLIWMQKKWRNFVRWRPSCCGSPDVARSVVFVDGPHHVVPDGWFLHDVVRFVGEVMLKPADHVIQFWPSGVLGVV